MVLNEQIEFKLRIMGPSKCLWKKPNFHQSFQEVYHGVYYFLGYYAVQSVESEPMIRKEHIASIFRFEE
jgi:hypothetical protein